MKKNIPIIISALCCIMLAVCLFRISSLEEQIRTLKNETSGQLRNISYSVDNIYYNIERAIKEQENLLNDSKWEFISADFEAKTVTTKFEISLKEYVPGKTEVEILFDGKGYPMTYQNSSFTAEIAIPLFEESRIESVSIIDTESGAVTNQQVDWHLSPRYDYLPIVYAQYGGSVSHREKNSLKFDGEIQIDAECRNSDIAIETITLYEYINDSEISKADVPLNTVSEKSQQAHSAETWGRSAPEKGYFVSYYYSFDKTVEIPSGSIYSTYIEVTDSLGLRHRSIIKREKIDENGKWVSDDGWYMNGIESDIYDADSKPIYIVSEELYS